MSDIAIRVENIGKLYHIGVAQRHDTLRDALVDAVPRIMRKNRSSDSSNEGQEDAFWALRDVSFEVKRGEVLGVIGRNGAGKSTLLKILSRITEPTEGRIVLNGRVASLLEVGTGFHPELTGRENVYLNGAILGMKRAEIARKFDEIVAFAEIERFLDTPVKRYSSGMYVRLAFAVAAHLEPEILLVDEVLAVGDSQFQKKCLGKMGDVAKEGRTVLFVSHNMRAMSSLTGRAALLGDGRVLYDGTTVDAINTYLNLGTTAYEGLEAYRHVRNEAAVRISQVSVNGRQPPVAMYMREDIDIVLEIVSARGHENVCVTVIFWDGLGRNVTTICSLDQPREVPLMEGLNRVRVSLPLTSLSPGSYLIDVALNPSFTEPAWDVIRGVPIGDILPSQDTGRESFMSANRTWGAVYIDDVRWENEDAKR